MKKEQFLKELKKRLKNSTARGETERVCQYYCELIDEAVESGKTEKEAVECLTSPAEIAKRIIDEFNGVNGAEFFDDNQGLGVKNKSQNRTGGQTALKILAFVAVLIFVLPLVIAFASVLFGVFIACFSVVASFIICGVALPIYAAIVGIVGQSLMVFFAYCAAGLLLLGLGLFGARVVKSAFMLVFNTVKGVSRATIKLLRV